MMAKAIPHTNEAATIGRQALASLLSDYRKRGEKAITDLRERDPMTYCWAMAFLATWDGPSD